MQPAAASSDRAFVDRFHRAAEHRGFDDRGPHHVRHFQIDAEFRRAVDLVRNVQPRETPADELVLIGPLERGLLLELDRGRLDRELAEPERASRRLVRDLAHRRCAIGRGHAPARRRRRDQALARARAGLLDDLALLADRAAAAGGERPVNFVLPEIAIGRRVFRFHERPVAFELFGEDLRERGEASLPHLGAAVADDHRVVGLDHDPGVDLAGHAGRVIVPRAHGAQRCRLGRSAEADAERKAAGGGERGDDELATGESLIDHCHRGVLPAHVRIKAAARWIARRSRS